MPKGKKPVVDSSDGDDADAPSFNEQAGMSACLVFC